MMSRLTGSYLPAPSAVREQGSSNAAGDVAGETETPVTGFVVRNVVASDAAKLGSLFYESYKGTVDDEGQTLEQAVAEAEETLAGRYGPMIWSASYVVLDGDQIVSTSIVTDFKNTPLVAFAATLPAYQGKGLAKHTMKKSIAALCAIGRHEVRLVVTETNLKALTLYEKLGFAALDNKLRTEST